MLVSQSVCDTFICQHSTACGHNAGGKGSRTTLEQMSGQAQIQTMPDHPPPQRQHEHLTRLGATFHSV